MQMPEETQQSDNEPTPHVEKVPCVVCREQISKCAQKCIHCDSYQHRYRRLLGFSGLVLALLVALVSVVTDLLPVLKDFLTEEDSNIVGSVVGAQFQTMSVVLNNLGSRPGVVGRTWLLFSDPQGNFQITIWLGSPETFSGVVQSGEAKPFKVRVDIGTLVIHPRGLVEPSCRLVIEVVSFAGRNRHLQLRLPEPDCHLVMTGKSR